MVFRSVQPKLTKFTAVWVSTVATSQLLVGQRYHFPPIFSVPKSHQRDLHKRMAVVRRISRGRIVLLHLHSRRMRACGDSLRALIRDPITSCVDTKSLVTIIITISDASEREGRKRDETRFAHCGPRNVTFPRGVGGEEVTSSTVRRRGSGIKVLSHFRIALKNALSEPWSRSLP